MGMRFVLVPPGKFWMGSPKGEKERYADERFHEVEIARPFWLGVFPVTQAQYRQVAGHNPGDFGPDGMSDRARDLDRGTLPVEGVTLRDAEAFCEALGELRGEVRAGRKYRLPTEAEWEYACRGAGVHRTPFHYGPALSSHLANFNGTKPYGGGAAGPDLERPTPVGSYRPNVLGLYDLHGNVWEYCTDNYYATGEEEPVEGQSRVLRGGAWASGSIGYRAAHRGMVGEDEADNDTGFRVVLEWRG